VITGDYDYLQNLAKFNVCAEHHMPLVVAWHSQEKTWFLRCGVCEYPSAITRQLSLTQEYKAGKELPSPLKENVEKAIRRKQMQEGKQPIPKEFSLMPTTDLATGELLTPAHIQALIKYTREYGLDPYRGHCVLMYGKPYITIDGYLFHAHLTHRPYTLSSRPLEVKEYIRYKLGRTDHAWVAELTFTDTSSTFTGLGIVTYEEMTAKSPRDETKLRSPVVAAHPWQLAQKRAEWQVLRKAFPIGSSPSDSP